jgi:hypothetical protein
MAVGMPLFSEIQFYSLQDYARKPKQQNKLNIISVLGYGALQPGKIY